MYSGRHFTGSTLTLTEDDSDFRDQGFDDTLESFEVKGGPQSDNVLIKFSNYTVNFYDHHETS